MKIIIHKPARTGLTGTLLCLIFLVSQAVYAQDNRGYRLTLQQAIAMGKEKNNLVKAAVREETAAAADLQDARTGILPTILANGSYQRFTSLTLYDSFLGGAHAVPKRPSSNGADLGLSAAFNLYSGGRQKAFIAEQSGKKELAGVGTEEQTAGVGLQVVAQYLSVVRLNDQRRITLEQVVRAETRLKNINALFANQKVTRSDQLRAELVLSSVKLNLEAVENDITINSQKLSVLLGLADSASVLPADSANMTRPSAESLGALVVDAPAGAYGVRKSDLNLKIQDARIEGIKSNYAPSFSLYSAYGLSYPNTIFYPPVDQAYSIGFVGLRVSYNLSSLYQNKNKMSAARTRLDELRFVRQNIRDNVNQEASGLLIKYREALNRITVSERSIEQARVNYKIVSAKYYNQLALLTDLLDADNLYQESRFSLVQAQTTAQFIYYQLLFTTGKL